MRRQLAVAGLVGAVAGVLAYVYTYMPAGFEQAAPPPAVKAASGSAGGRPEFSPPVMPKGYRADSAVIRDPFAVPPEFARPAAAAEAPRQGLQGLGQAAGPVRPAAEKEVAEKEILLLGVVSSAGAKAAIIQYGENSCAYTVGEKVGPFRISRISDTAVTLVGPSGTRTISLKR